MIMWLAYVLVRQLLICWCTGMYTNHDIMTRGYSASGLIMCTGKAIPQVGRVPKPACGGMRNATNLSESV